MVKKAVKPVKKSLKGVKKTSKVAVKRTSPSLKKSEAHPGKTLSKEDGWLPCWSDPTRQPVKVVEVKKSE